jgi:hypothetical protein
MALQQPPKRPTGASGLLMLVVLLTVIAVLAFLAWTSGSTQAPDPQDTGVPATMPAGATPAG